MTALSTCAMRTEAPEFFDVAGVWIWVGVSGERSTLCLFRFRTAETAE